jgi:exodeoxyribonuclease V beta subunit
VIENDPPPLYPFPEELLRVPRRASAVIEASAGTGKTYLLEHLVVDRIIRGDARLEEILVVTFTEKAAAELVHRVRAKIEEILQELDDPAGARRPEAPVVDADRCWRLDAGARRRLRDALGAFDRATITTIHGFCQRVLTENAFASRRLLVQQHVDSLKAFGDAFKEALRADLATSPALVPYLRAWLASGRSVDQLERNLYIARVLRRPFGVPYDEARLRAAIEAYAALPVDPYLKEMIKRRTGGVTANTIERRAQAVSALCRRFLEHRDPATFLREVDAAVEDKKDLFLYVDENLAPPFAAEVVARFHAAFLALGDAAVPLATAASDLFLPHVAERLEARKRAAGLYDFDDMLSEVAAALRGPGGPALIASLRRRYRLAIIDEFQDTDSVQWEIFRAVFHASGGDNPLTIVGDPKQSIYGFRGADLPTYEGARRAISGGDAPTVRLGRNFRSTRAVVDAYNAILDPDADPPFFDDAGLYPEPVVAAEAGAAPGPAPSPVRLLAVRPAEGAEITKLPLRQVRHALTRAIAREIQGLRAADPAFDPSEVFVLTRTNAEARQVAAALREAGLPHVIYNQEKLYETDEARHVLDLLEAVEDPRDPGRRARAWLTPFFGLGLGDLEGARGLASGHPLEERLHAWRAVAEARDWPRLFDRILDESGFTCRELLVGGSARRLTNTLQLFDQLLGEASRQAASLGDLVRRLRALTERVTVPAPEEGTVQRIEGDRAAVQIMTMHKAKGLEADHVFLYGAFSAFRGVKVHAYARDGERVLHAGRPRRRAVAAALEREASGEDQRLLYVALTRARRRLYLPFAGPRSQEVEGERRFEDVYWRIGGAYQHVHRRLRVLVAERDARLPLDEREVACPAPPDQRAARLAGLTAFRPAPSDLAWTFPAEALAERRRRHAGIIVTSYSRLREARGEAGQAAAASEILDEVEAPFEPGEGALPGGAPWGIFLHALLEAVPLASLADGPPLEAWAARPEIAALVDAALRSHGRDGSHRGEILRLVHAALTARLPLDEAVPGARPLPGVTAAGRVAREVEFLFPLPARSGAGAGVGGAPRGFVKGYIDAVLEHEGRAYFVDWKSDALASFAPEAVAAHVAQSYDLQLRLYTLALVKMLGITDRPGYEARFGGAAYVFLRALPDGLHVRRPSWEDVVRWEDDLGREVG